MNTYSMNKLERDVNYISFDIFNTLIKRNFGEPKDVFTYVKRICEKQNIICPENFVELRIRADYIAQEKYSGCATIDEIYKELECLSYIDNMETIKEIEIKLEIDNCTGNKSIIEKFNKLLNKGFHIVIISDMYLSSSVLRNLLEKCGIVGFEKIYVSCELRASKGKGDIYDCVLADLNIKPSHLLHIGDNKKGDWIVPICKGIKSELIKTSNINCCFTKAKCSDIDFRTLQAAEKNFCENMNFAEQIGCRTLGFVLFGFIKWLKCKMSEDSIDKVLFFARDGYIVKKAFELFNDYDLVETKYVYCSRRAFTVPLIWTCSSLNDIQNLIPFPHRLSLRQFASRIGLENYDFDNAIFDDIDIGKEYDRFRLFEQCFFDKVFFILFNEAVSNSKIEYEAIKQYFIKLELSGNIAVVDIGYHGTMQYAFQRLLNEMNIAVNVVGYYVDISNDDSPINQDKIKARGYLDDKENFKGNYNNIQKFIPLFELMFLAPHGSTEKFEINENVVRPVLYPFEYEAYENDYNDIQNIQDGALSFINYLYEHKLFDLINISPDITLFYYKKMGMSPNLSEAEFWGNKVFFEYEPKYIAKPDSLFSYVLNIRKLKKDFANSHWKIGFLKRLFKLDLPYGRFFQLLKGFVR